MTALRPLGMNHVASGRAGRPRWASALVLLALVANVAAGFYYSDLGDQRAAATRAARKPVAAAARNLPDSMQRELARANDAMRAPDVPWNAVFSAIESAGSADVSLLAFDPAPEKKTLKLQAEARNMEAVLVYLRALSADPLFTAVSLQSHQVQQADPQHPVRFLLLLEWRGAP